jgi:poly-gamma-glutamate synthesis protein (capsule biosynthesis protein)
VVVAGFSFEQEMEQDARHRDRRATAAEGGRFDRRGFLKLTGISALGILSSEALAATDPKRPSPAAKEAGGREPGKPRLVTMFLCGDVMSGRGIDQVLPHPGDPRIHESYMKSARGYVELAEKMNGPIPKPVDFSYVWGHALKELEQAAPHVRIINLETAVTKSDDYWKGKGINYRMHPHNVGCISSAKIDCCALANNHILDWGYSGLTETLETLKRAGLKHAGAGRSIEEAALPAVMEIGGEGRVIVFSFGSEGSGIPSSWAASGRRPGVNLLEEMSAKTVQRIARQVREVKRPGDIVVASIHWGSNWGYEIPRRHTELAHGLIDEAGVDLIHGHSSHHPKAIEVYKKRPILYGCGDFLNDYEGIGGHEAFRNDLCLMYFVSSDPSTGELRRLQMTPLQIKRFMLTRASTNDARWLRAVLDREGRKFGTRVRMSPENRLTLLWT